MKRKYQVFISSTYEDLKDERKEIIQALLELDCIPSGMELFQASNDTQWDLIKRVIDDCDYYIVVIAGRYGSVHPITEKSYTQMEYEYAIQQNIPVIGFVYRLPETLPFNKVDSDKESIDKLNAFKALVKQKMIRHWSNIYELGGVVSRGIIKLIETNPRDGWVKYYSEIIDKNSKSDDILSYVDKKIADIVEMVKISESTKLNSVSNSVNVFEIYDDVSFSKCNQNNDIFDSDFLHELISILTQDCLTAYCTLYWGQIVTIYERNCLWLLNTTLV